LRPEPLFQSWPPSVGVSTRLQMPTESRRESKKTFVALSMRPRLKLAVLEAKAPPECDVESGLPELFTSMVTVLAAALWRTMIRFQVLIVGVFEAPESQLVEPVPLLESTHRMSPAAAVSKRR
jgi:hypothetical protein